MSGLRFAALVLCFLPILTCTEPLLEDEDTDGWWPTLLRTKRASGSSQVWLPPSYGLPGYAAGGGSAPGLQAGGYPTVYPPTPGYVPNTAGGGSAPGLQAGGYASFYPPVPGYVPNTAGGGSAPGLQAGGYPSFYPPVPNTAGGYIPTSSYLTPSYPTPNYPSPGHFGSGAFSPGFSQAPSIGSVPVIHTAQHPTFSSYQPPAYSPTPSLPLSPGVTGNLVKPPGGNGGYVPPPQHSSSGPSSSSSTSYVSRSEIPPPYPAYPPNSYAPLKISVLGGQLFPLASSTFGSQSIAPESKPISASPFDNVFYPSSSLSVPKPTYSYPNYPLKPSYSTPSYSKPSLSLPFSSSFNYNKPNYNSFGSFYYPHHIKSRSLSDSDSTNIQQSVSSALPNSSQPKDEQSNLSLISPSSSQESSSPIPFSSLWTKSVAYSSPYNVPVSPIPYNFPASTPFSSSPSSAFPSSSYPSTNYPVPYYPSQSTGPVYREIESDDTADIMQQRSHQLGKISIADGGLFSGISQPPPTYAIQDVTKYLTIPLPNIPKLIKTETEYLKPQTDYSFGTGGSGNDFNEGFDAGYNAGLKDANSGRGYESDYSYSSYGDKYSLPHESSYRSAEKSVGSDYSSPMSLSCQVNRQPPLALLQLYVKPSHGLTPAEGAAGQLSNPGYNYRTDETSIPSQTFSENGNLLDSGTSLVDASRIVQESDPDLFNFGQLTGEGFDPEVNGIFRNAYPFSNPPNYIPMSNYGHVSYGPSPYGSLPGYGAPYPPSYGTYQQYRPGHRESLPVDSNSKDSIESQASQKPSDSQSDKEKPSRKTNMTDRRENNSSPSSLPNNPNIHRQMMNTNIQIPQQPIPMFGNNRQFMNPQLHSQLMNSQMQPFQGIPPNFPNVRQMMGGQAQIPQQLHSFIPNANQMMKTNPQMQIPQQFNPMSANQLMGGSHHSIPVIPHQQQHPVFLHHVPRDDAETQKGVQNVKNTPVHKEPPPQHAVAPQKQERTQQSQEEEEQVQQTPNKPTSKDINSPKAAEPETPSSGKETSEKPASNTEGQSSDKKSSGQSLVKHQKVAVKSNTK